MLNDLKYYFELISQYRSSTSNILIKTIIVCERLPDLLGSTCSQRLKLAISTFLLENTNEQSNNLNSN